MGQGKHVNRQRQLIPLISPSGDTAPTPAALSLHNNFKNSIAALKRDLVRSIHYLSVIKDQKVYRAFGYASIFTYAEQTAGFNRSQTQAFLEIGRKLQGLPELKRALGNGAISWTKAKQIVRKADPANEREWIDLARTMTTRQLAKHEPATGSVHAKAQPGQSDVKPTSQDKPAKQAVQVPKSTAPKPADTACHMTFAFHPEDYSRWEKLNAALKRKHPGETKEGLMLRGLASILEMKDESASAPHLLIIHECPTCNTATQSNARGEFAADRALLESAQCDATVQSPDGTRRATIPPRLRRQVLARDRHRCQALNCRRGGFLQVHHRVPLAQGGSTSLENLVTLCAACHRRIHETEKEMNRARKDPLD